MPVAGVGVVVPVPIVWVIKVGVVVAGVAVVVCWRCCCGECRASRWRGSGSG